MHESLSPYAFGSIPSILVEMQFMCSVEGILFRKNLCETEASNIVIVNGYKIRKKI